MIVDEEVYAYLEHFGVKGMRWGVKGSSGPSNRELNKASRAKERKEFKTSIETARSRLKSGESKAELKKAKQAHAGNKATLGTREARKILREARQKHYDEVETSRFAKDGKEATKILLAAGGIFAGLTMLQMTLDKHA